MNFETQPASGDGDMLRNMRFGQKNLPLMKFELSKDDEDDGDDTRSADSAGFKHGSHEKKKKDDSS